MSAHLHILAETARQVKLRDRLILVLLVLLGIALAGWHYSRANLRVDIQPGLTSRTTVTPGVVPDANLFTFSAYILQQLNRWPSSGAVDYPERIDRLNPFFTPNFRAWLQRDAQSRGRMGELRSRTRVWTLVDGAQFEPGRVIPRGSGAWDVIIDADIDETMHGQAVKQVRLRYTVRVLAMDIDSEANPFGLVIAGFGDGPIRLEDPQ